MTVDNFKVFKFDELTSTFDKAKELLQTYDTGVVVANRQTKGKGKGTRKFVSNEGGLYFTLFFKNAKISPLDSLKTVINTGLSVYKVLKNLGFNAKLKWPNDVLVGGKKVCGILSETVIIGDKIDLMVGVGINVNSTCFDEFDDVATSLFLQSGKRIEVDEFGQQIVAQILKELFVFDDKTKEFFEASKLLGKRVKVTNGDENYFVLVNGLSQDGFLCGTRDGVQTKIVCGDIKEV